MERESGGVNGERHGPVFERPDGSRSWWDNGKLHCVDGPAMEHESGGLMENATSR